MVLDLADIGIEPMLQVQQVLIYNGVYECSSCVQRGDALEGACSRNFLCGHRGMKEECVSMMRELQTGNSSKTSPRVMS